MEGLENVSYSLFAIHYGDDFFYVFIRPSRGGVFIPIRWTWTTIDEACFLGHDMWKNENVKNSPLYV